MVSSTSIVTCSNKILTIIHLLTVPVFDVSDPISFEITFFSISVLLSGSTPITISDSESC